MAIDIDGYAVLGAIARNPESFPAIRNDVSKVARTLVVKQLKEKAIQVAALRAILQAVGLDSFNLILDLMSDPDIKSLVGKVDKQNAEVKSGTPQSQRRHVSELACGQVDPSAKKAKVTKAVTPKAPKPTIERAGSARFSKAKKKV